MRVLFAHNIHIKKDIEGNLYTHSSYNENVWKRYDTLATKLDIFAREEEKMISKIEAQSKFESFNNEVRGVIHYQDIHKSIVSFANPLAHIKNNRIIKKNVLDHDIVIARLPSYTGFKAIKYAKKNNIPYICEVVACSWDGLWNHSLKGKVVAPFSFLQLKSAIKDAPYVVYVTNSFLQKRYPTKGKHVNCSNVALTEFNEEVLTKRVSKIKSRDDNDMKIIIGTTAAVDVKFKGQQYVIEALGVLKKSGITNYEYQLVGGGNSSYLRSIAKKNNVESQVKFLGSKSHKAVFDWLEEIDIYAQPSKQEGLPRALIEAMSRAVPAFGANTAGIPELLEGKFIFSNSKDNINEIIKIIKSFSKETMIVQANRNFKESMKYEKSIIDKRRKKFFDEFKIDTEIK